MAGSENVVAVLGTGIMGAAMARNLLGAGMEVRVWNRSREKAEPLADSGATVAGSPKEAVDGAGFVVTMLPTPAPSRRFSVRVPSRGSPEMASGCR